MGGIAKVKIRGDRCIKCILSTPKSEEGQWGTGAWINWKGTEVSGGGWMRLKAFQMSSCGALRGSEQKCNTVALESHLGPFT